MYLSERLDCFVIFSEFKTSDLDTHYSLGLQVIKHFMAMSHASQSMMRYHTLEVLFSLINLLLDNAQVVVVPSGTCFPPKGYKGKEYCVYELYK